VPVPHGREFRRLAETFNRLARDLRRNQERLLEQERLRKELEIGRRIQEELLPRAPFRSRFAEIGGVSIPAREVGGDFFNYFPLSEREVAILVGDVSGKGVPAALYTAFAGELVRGRTFRNRLMAEKASPAGVLTSINTILHQRQLEEMYCTLCYANFDFKRRTVVLSNSGLPYPVRCSTGQPCAQIDLPGVPLGSFAGSTYDELTFPLELNDVWVFCSDGVFEAMDAQGREFTAARLLPVIERTRTRHANDIVNAIFDAVAEFRGDTPPNDDMTAVALRITA
jgi:sigma-B regulation protein RsbU (phosphoserine phosphatase)